MRTWIVVLAAGLALAGAGQASAGCWATVGLHTPVSEPAAGGTWPVELTVGMLVVVLVLLFFVGQTAIFLLRLVAAERRGRRRPLASPTRTVGELEDASGRESGESSEPREPGASGESGERPTKRGRS